MTPDRQILNRVRGGDRAAADIRAQGSSSPATPVARTQRTLGNRAVQRALSASAPEPDACDIAPEIAQAIAAQRGGGAALPQDVRANMENVFGADFSSVRVHAGAQAADLSRSLSARAFTTGADIFFARGAYDPGSRSGEKLIAHELTHVLQQTGGASVPSVQGKLTLGPENDVFEREADSAAESVAVESTASAALNAPASGIQRNGSDDEEKKLETPETSEDEESETRKSGGNEKEEASEEAGANSSSSSPDRVLQHTLDLTEQAKANKLFYDAQFKGSPVKAKSAAPVSLEDAGAVPLKSERELALFNAEINDKDNPTRRKKKKGLFGKPKYQSTGNCATLASALLFQLDKAGIAGAATHWVLPEAETAIVPVQGFADPELHGNLFDEGGNLVGNHFVFSGHNVVKWGDELYDPTTGSSYTEDEFNSKKRTLTSSSSSNESGRFKIEGGFEWGGILYTEVERRKRGNRNNLSVWRLVTPGRDPSSSSFSSSSPSSSSSSSSSSWLPWNRKKE